MTTPLQPVRFLPALLRPALVGRRLGAIGLLCATLLAAALAPSAHAAPMPSGDRKVQLSAREQPIASFLQDLFGQIDVPVTVSASVKGAVNGNFNGEAETIARSVSRAFSLVTYFDGTVMHVYTANEMTARTFPTSAMVAERVLRTAAEMQLPDARNTLRTTRDGAIMASGTRRFVEQVEELTRASQVGQVQAPMGFKVFYLRYAWAHDVTVSFGSRQMMVPGVASIVRSLVTSSARSPVSMASQEQQLRPTQPKLKGQGMGRTPQQQPTLGLPEGNDPRSGTADVLMAAYGGAAPSGFVGNGNGGNNGSGNGGNGMMLGDPQQVRIEADTRLNAVIVRDAPERLPFYEQLVQSLDVEPQSLEIEATIIDVNTDRMRELGINWRGGIGKSSVLFGRGDESDLRLQNGGSVIGSAITPSAAGGVISAVIGDAAQFVARMSAMQSDGAARVVSSPQVVTLSNVEAIFDNSSTFYVRVAGRDEVDLFNVSAGTSLRVTPHVFKDNNGVRIKLLVNLETGSVSEQRVDSIPVVERSSINTQALIYEGESLLIGGLTRESSGKGTDKVPFLGDLPLIGNLFKVQRDSGARIERMFLISPRLSAHRSSAMGAKPVAAVAPAPAPTPAPMPAPQLPAVPAPVPAPIPAQSSIQPAPAAPPAAPPAAAPTRAAARSADAAEVERLVQQLANMGAAQQRTASPATAPAVPAAGTTRSVATTAPARPRDTAPSTASACTPTWCPPGATRAEPESPTSDCTPSLCPGRQGGTN
jgi:type III secretion protein C